jgi:hypothetical protein
MAAPTARYDKGTFTDSPCTQESNILVESVDLSTSRDKKLWKDITTGCDVLRRDENAKCKWDIKGWVKAVSGFVTQHVGTAVTSLANFASTIAGFDPAVGSLTFVDQKHSWSIQELRKLDFSVEHDPHIA